MVSSMKEAQQICKTGLAVQAVFEVLSGSNEDEEGKIIQNILLDDCGYCIHVTVGEWISMKTVAKIANLFGDENPAITLEKGGIKIICLNKNERYFF